MRLLKLICSSVLALAGLIGVGAIITSRSVHAAPLADIVPVTTAVQASIVPVTTTLQAAIDAAQDGDIISIPAGTYTESLTINKNLTLTGVTSATTIIHAVTNQRVITVTSGYNLQLYNLALTGGRAISDSGGGVRINDGSLRLVNILIADNRADYGGGLFQGGAGRVDAIDSRIERNQSDIDGGGLSANGDVALTDTLVLSNTADRDGGGLNVWPGRVDIVRGSFAGNQALSRNGGGVFINTGRLQLVSVLIVDNGADYGGGVFQGGAGRVDVINSRIERNRSDIDGGGLYVNGDAALTDTLVLSNTATRDGGGLNVWAGRADMVRGSFAGNQALGRNGGGININNSLSISGTSFISNTATQDGGGVLQWNSNQFVVVNNARFDRNSVIRNGGGLNIAQGATTTLTGTLFLDNRADSYLTTETDTLGGGLYFSGTGLLQINASTFRANRALCSICSHSDGGGAYVYAATAAVVQDSLFEINSASLGGGLNGYGLVTIRRSIFRDNRGSFGGGVNFGFNIGGGRFGASLVVQDTDFLRNQAPRGGGLLAEGNVEIAQSRFISNTGGSGTGGLHLTSATARLTNTVIAQNRTNTGGGLYVSGGTTLHAQHTTVVSNTTTSGESNGVYVAGATGSSVWLTNTILISHTIGITVSAGSTATLNSTLWFGNQVDTIGNVSTAHNTSGNPALAADGYHLTAASQSAIDQGVNSGVPIDIDGDPRPIGNGYDLGADEYRAKIYLPLVLRQ